MNVQPDYAGDSPGEEPKVGHDVESPPTGEQSEFNLANQKDQLERGLKSRHIQFLALGKLQPIPSSARARAVRHGR